MFTKSAKRNFFSFHWQYKLLFLCMICTVSCKTGDLFERLQNIPGAAWKSNYQPSFSFDIKDTTAMYDVFITVRHTNAYAYNNIWIESELELPGDSARKQKLDLQLAGSEGWLGTGMDDIFERRIKVTAAPQQFRRSGLVTFTLKQVMREDPLPGIMQVGIRVEKLH